jgi:hypothetical protein
MTTGPLNDPRALLARLDALAESLAATEGGVALLGLGSVGLERERLDCYSDLDFFVITADGTKEYFINDLSWIESAAPIGYAFQNTRDGYKLMFRDGVFCEFAVFETGELRKIPFSPGALIWSRPGFDPELLRPEPGARRDPLEEQEAWKLGEILTNLYVGMLRYARGEKLSAHRFTQGYAIDRLLELADDCETPRAVSPDPFDPARRFEGRFPGLAARLPEFLTGYSQIPAGVRALLRFLDEHYDYSVLMKNYILELCDVSEH